MNDLSRRALLAGTAIAGLTLASPKTVKAEIVATETLEVLIKETHRLWEKTNALSDEWMALDNRCFHINMPLKFSPHYPLVTVNSEDEVIKQIDVWYHPNPKLKVKKLRENLTRFRKLVEERAVLRKKYKVDGLWDALTVMENRASTEGEKIRRYPAKTKAELLMKIEYFTDDDLYDTFFEWIIADINRINEVLL